MSHPAFNVNYKSVKSRVVPQYRSSDLWLSVEIWSSDLKSGRSSVVFQIRPIARKYGKLELIQVMKTLMKIMYDRATELERGFPENHDFFRRSSMFEEILRATQNPRSKTYWKAPAGALRIL